MNESHREMYQFVGLAVQSAQVFEAIFVMAAKLALKQTDVDVLEKVVPLSASHSFKQPVTAILRELRPGALDELLLGRVVSLVERRHHIIHRLFLEGKWPAVEDREGCRSLVQLCADFVNDANELSLDFGMILIDWLKRFPETLAIAHDHEARIRQLISSTPHLPVCPARPEEIQ